MGDYRQEKKENKKEIGKSMSERDEDWGSIEEENRREDEGRVEKKRVPVEQDNEKKEAESSRIRMEKISDSSKLMTHKYSWCNGILFEDKKYPTSRYMLYIHTSYVIRCSIISVILSMTHVPLLHMIVILVVECMYVSYMYKYHHTIHTIDRCIDILNIVINIIYILIKLASLFTSDHTNQYTISSIISYIIIMHYTINMIYVCIYILYYVYTICKTKSSGVSYTIVYVGAFNDNDDVVVDVSDNNDDSMGNVLPNTIHNIRSNQIHPINIPTTTFHNNKKIGTIPQNSYLRDLVLEGIDHMNRYKPLVMNKDRMDDL